jgi:pantoate--beta-alanine ligase
VIERMVAQFAMPVEIVGEPTCRAEDGLALSSRNGYLSPQERAEAVQLSAQLRAMAAAVQAGLNDGVTLENQATQALSARGWKVDYVSLRQRLDLLPPAPGEPIAGRCVALAAAKLGHTRLIDNLEL